MENNRRLGLCKYMKALQYNNLINDLEYSKLVDYIMSNQSTHKKHRQFYVDSKGSVYWWDTNDNQIRIEFINYLFLIKTNVHRRLDNTYSWLKIN